MAMQIGKALSAAAGAAATGLGALGSTNGTSGSSNASGYGYGYGGGGSNSASAGYNWSDAYGYGMSNQQGEGWSNSWGNAYGENYGQVYGREASAIDQYNAAVANEKAEELWQQQAAYNSKEAALNRTWQEYMSNTAYQRAVADLKASGLNPILAVGNIGASTPTGGAAVAGLAQSAKANATAEQRSGGYNYSNSGSSSYNYNRANSRSENWSKSYGENWSKSNSWEAWKNYNESQAVSNWNNNVRELTQNMISGTKNIIKSAGSALNNYLKDNSAVGKALAGAVSGAKILGNYGIMGKRKK